jgi:glycoprotein 3-alpha-L-fucosyltransferase
VGKQVDLVGFLCVFFFFKKGWGFCSGKISVIKHYKFTLAFENCNVEDYVTEKFADALVAGSVPVHLGVSRSNLEMFAPSSNSFLNALDFESPALLAREMLRLHHDDQAYAKMLEWKNLPSLNETPLGRMMAAHSDVSGT